MIPIGDDNVTIRFPLMTYALLAAIAVAWFFVQGAGFDHYVLVSSVCNLGLVPGEITGQAPIGEAVPISPGLACVVDNDPVNPWTPLTSMFLHGGWGHILGNCLFLWVFGNNVEDAMGRLRFLLFYLICGLAAAFAQVVVHPGSAVPMVGASGAISGVMGGYLVLFPHARVRCVWWLFIFITFVRLPAWLMLAIWFGSQFLIPKGAGIAAMAHVGGFVAGLILVKLFARRPR